MTYKTCFSPNKNDTAHILRTLHKSRYTLDTGHTTNTCIPSRNCTMFFPHTYAHTHYSTYKKYSKACSTYTTLYLHTLQSWDTGQTPNAYTQFTQYNTKHYNAKQNSTVHNKNNILFTHTKKYLHRYICNLYDVRQGCATMPYLALFVLHYMHRCIPMYILLLCLVISKVNKKMNEFVQTCVL